MVKNQRLVRAFAVMAGLSLLAAACGDDDDEAASTTTAPADEETTTTAPDDGGGETEGALEGMRGTTPAPATIDPSFETRARALDPALVDLNYGPESYDAVVTITLAAHTAGDDGSALGDAINEVTKNGEKCTTFAECLPLVQAGTDIDYDGASGPLEFSDNGEPTLGSYAILEFGPDNRLLDDPDNISAELTPDVIAAIEATPVEVERAGDGVLRIGTLLPETGSLAFLGPPEVAGVTLALEDVNAAGGYNGQPVEVSEGDSGDTSTDTANTTVDRLLSENVDAIIGAASSAVTLTVIDKITSAGVIQLSPANTSAQLTDYPDMGLYFRDAPPDILQGQVLAGVIADDGVSSIAMMVLNDPYGTGLADSLADNFEQSGGEVVERIEYDPQASTFDAEVGQIADADADAVVVIGFEESARIIATMVEQGIGPTDNPVYGCDGNMGNALGEDFDAL